ncbi:RNA 2',3'-cyclic phosphodiesterase [Aurantiacibacter aquimixticola]|uniref:RNA 2',3'-cyclic phosphodiesterase n=1 Tax=Aurantiacibacter aquimixticola TaxID=1958945 RepID=A0A419RT23_9SPHN|nr:RNA 2',3'-cyclic phosphodiesterase [Aurantiacibacter aquimixticola]RJY08894.1 RNA 2',3'-cyclic phosphodiesterase [Aurantiacibacter aquimixticola]
MTRRLFVALPLPEPIREALLDTMEGISGARWQDADNLHITLRFVGEVDRHTTADLETALETVPFAPFSIALSGVGHFEGHKRARAIWAGVTPNSALADLQHSVEMACRRAGLRAENRKFVPHVTLARLNSGSGHIGEWLHENGTLALGPWTADCFALFESDLTPQGPIYTQLTEFR